MALARGWSAGREGVSSGGMGMSQSSRSARSENYPQRDFIISQAILQFNLEFAIRFARVLPTAPPPRLIRISSVQISQVLERRGTC